jgi:anaerobic selenocysteine-containing dehydrogenase
MRVLSPASPWRMNSSYGNDSGIARRDPSPEVLLHPDDADRRGLADGAWVELANATGRLPVQVRRSDVAQPGVAVVYKGRWPKLDPSGANVNVLNPGDKSDLGESSCVHAVEAEIVTP